MGIGSYPAHHTSGLNVRTISLQPDGENRWSEDIQGADDPFTLQPEAQAAMEQAAKAFNSIRIARLPTRYPMGSEKHLVQTLTGRETPARGLTADIGVVVHNPATALAVQEALRHGRPLVSRVMTVSGGAIRTPANLRVPLGTPIQYIIDHCGGFTTEPARLISGGPMMGQPMPSTRIPTVKGANGLLALTAAETSRREAMPCIRCAS